MKKSALAEARLRRVASQSTAVASGYYPTILTLSLTALIYKFLIQDGPGNTYVLFIFFGIIATTAANDKCKAINRRLDAIDKIQTIRDENACDEDGKKQ